MLVFVKDEIESFKDFNYAKAGFRRRKALKRIPLHVETVLLVNKLCSVCSDKACNRKKNAI